MKTDIRSPLHLFFRMNKLSLSGALASYHLHGLSLTHSCLSMLLLLTNLKFYTILQIWSLCAKERQIITPLGLLVMFLRLAFTGARMHYWSMHVCPLSSQSTPSLHCCVVTLRLVQHHICLLLGSVRFVLAHFSRLSPEWHFYVTHELAEDAVYPTVQATTNDFK